MATKSKIEWTETTWNPVAGCSIVSPGCHNCYAMKMAKRLAAMGQAKYAGLTDDAGRWTGKLSFSESDLLAPLKWKKPRRVFVNSMSDLFHEDLPEEWIHQVFAVMALCPQHTFQVLTKRAERMKQIVRGCFFAGSVDKAKCKIMGDMPDSGRDVDACVGEEGTGYFEHGYLANVWLGVSVEDQKRADDRIPHLLRIPAAVHFLSCEPLLGPIELGRAYMGPYNAFMGACGHGVEWVIVGGESGHDARPMHPDWARSLRDQCQAAGVPFFFKQWGGWAPSVAQPVRGTHTGGGIYMRPDGHWGNQGDWWDGNAAAMDRVRKKAAGRLLDGREWNEFPAAEVAAS